MVINIIIILMFDIVSKQNNTYIISLYMTIYTNDKCSIYYNT